MKDYSQYINELPYALNESSVRFVIKKGTTLIEKGAPVDFVYLFLDGDLNTIGIHENGEEFSFGHPQPGRYIGDLEILSKIDTYEASVIAEADTEVLRFSADQFRKYVSEDVVFLSVVATGMANEMLRESQEQEEE